MATFTNQTDQFGPLQLYKPDYSFLTQVYGTRQAEYDRGFNTVKSLYNSALNSPVTSEANEAFRQEAFKKIQNSLKSVSGVDLSNPTNITRAQNLLNPITDDEELMRDMSVTRYNADQEQRLNAVKNSSDPEIRKQYNEYSAKAIQLSKEDLRTAKRGTGEVAKVRPGEFIPQEDIAEYLNKAAKEQGIKIAFSEADGKGYIVNTENGTRAYGAFTNWAKTMMGNRFDRQLQQRGYVESENIIRNTMAENKVGRDVATQMVSDKLSKELTTQSATDGVEADKQLKELNDNINLYKKEYPNGVPETKLADFKKLVTQRDEYKKQLEEARTVNYNVQNDGASYVAANIANIFTKEAKNSIAHNWAKTRADATAKTELKDDQVVLTKWKIASDERQTSMRIASSERIAQMHEAGTQARWEKDHALKLAKLKAENKLPNEDRIGTFATTSDTKGVDILGQANKETQERMFNTVFSAGDGIVNQVLDTKYQGQLYSVMAKVKQIESGNDVKLTAEEKNLIAQVGKQLNVTVYNPTNSATARAVIDNITTGMVTKAQVRIKQYASMGKSSKAGQLATALNGVISDMHVLNEQYDNQKSNYKKVAAIVTDGSGHIKSGFEGAKITGYFKDGTPIIDVTGMSVEKRDFVSKQVDDQYNTRAGQAGAIYQFNALDAKDVFAITNSNGMVSAKDQNGNDVDMSTLRSLPADQLKEMLGKTAQVAYDPGNKNVVVKLKVDPSSGIAKTLKLDDTSVIDVTIPYKAIQANPDDYGRLGLYINKNTANVTSYNNNFAKFVSEPTATITAPSTYTNAGFDYSISGTRNSNGQYGLNINYEYTNPSTGKTEKHHSFKPINNPGDPAEFLAAQSMITSVFDSYTLNRQQYEDQVNGNVSTYEYSDDDFDLD